MNKNGNRRHAVILTTILALLLLVGCSSAKTEDVKEELATTAQVEVNEVEQEAEAETVAEEVVESAVAEVETETVEEVQYETPEEWVESLQLEEPTIVIWNSQTMENTVLQEDQEYQLKENDKILLTLGGRMNSFNCNPMSVFQSCEPFEQLYLDISLDIVGKQKIDFEFDVNGEMYTKAATFIAISSEKQEMVDWETWATNTDTEDVRLAVWNEITGAQILLENGSKYEIQEGDRFAIADRDSIRFVNTVSGEVSAIECETGSYYEIPAEKGNIAVLVRLEEGEYLYNFWLVEY